MSIYPWNIDRSLARDISNRPHGDAGNAVLLRVLEMVAPMDIATLAAHGWDVDISPDGFVLGFRDKIAGTEDSEIFTVDEFVDVEEPRDVHAAANRLQEILTELHKIK